ncbi:hypothetical protein PENTCL1PPCAC_7498, partial [Pristionchus entomophagus]
AHLWPWVHEQSRDQSSHHHHPRSDSGYQQSITPKWLWDQASGSLRYARDSPTPTVNGKSLCSALVSSSEFDNDERGTRKVRSPFTPIPYAGYNYYWDANFLPIIVRPQRRSICTHIISREEMDEKVEIWNGTRFSSIAWSCPVLEECCEWECCTRVGQRMLMVYGYFLLLFILLIVITAACILLCYYVCIVRKKRAKTVPVPFAVYIAPRNTSSSTNVTPVQHMPEFGTEPHPPGPSTRPSQ